MFLFFCIFENMIKKFFNDIYVLFRIISQQISQGFNDVKSIESNNQKEIYLNKFKFREFKQENQYYPNNTNFKKRFLEIDLKFIIDEKGNYKNIELFNKKGLNKFYYPSIKIKKTKKTAYFEASKKLIDSYKNWIPHRNNKAYVEKLTIKTIQFFYHKDYFDSTKEFCLNPQKRASYKDKDSSLYGRLIRGNVGCDGIINLICIVEKDGSLSNFEFISIEGKGIQEWALEGLDQLGKWLPAMNKGRIVRSQLDLRIYI